jgi:tetratricopeptide (TPR) repeat protein
MVKLGLNLKRYSWVESFVKEYADCLPEREMQDALYYNLAELYFFQGKYDAALSQLRHVEFTDVHYKLGGRALLAKIYYEQGQWEALEALLNAFRVFLRRNQAISGEVKAPYRKFIQVITAMVRGLPDSYGPLIRKVRANKAINNRDWLLAQMENV